MHDIKDNSIGLLQPSSKDLHDKIFKLSPPLTLGKKEKFWEILRIIAYNEFKLRNNKSWYYGRKNWLTNWNEQSEATVIENMKAAVGNVITLLDSNVKAIK